MAMQMAVYDDYFIVLSNKADGHVIKKAKELCGTAAFSLKFDKSKESSSSRSPVMFERNALASRTLKYRPTPLVTLS